MPTRRFVHTLFSSFVTRMFMLTALAVVMLVMTTNAANAAQAIQSFTLHDHLRFQWQHQLVTFPLDASAAAALGDGATDGYRLFDPSGKPIAFQRFEKEGKPFLAFFADVPELTQVNYQLVKAESGMAATPASAVTIKISADDLRMANANTGVSIANTLAVAKDGPVRHLYMADGQWVGRSIMPDDLTVSSYEARVTAQGPVFGEIECTYQFTQGGSWTLRFRLPGDGKVVLIEEHLNEVNSKGDWLFRFAAKDAPTHMLNRVGYDSTYPKAAKDTLAGSDIRTDQGRHGWTLKPWHSWWNHFDGVAFHAMRLPANKTLALLDSDKVRSNEWFIVDQGQTPEASWLESDARKTLDQPVPTLLLGAGIASEWAKDGQPGQSHRIRLIHLKEDEFEIRMPLGEWPGRRWFIGSSLSKQAYFENTKLTEAHAQVVNYYNRPLDRVKDMVLSWKSESDKPTSYIFPSQEELEPMRQANLEIGRGSNARRRTIKNYILYPEKNQSVRKDFEKNMLPGLLKAGGFILEADPTIGVGRNAGINSALHHIGINTENEAFLADAAFGHFNLSDADRESLRARLALIAYNIASGNLVNTSKGFSNHANMTATMYGGLGLVACTLADHPEAANWAKITQDMNLSFLKNWSGPNGSWTEAPHYQLVTMNSMLVFGLAAHRAGLNDFIFDPRLKSTVLYLANISTPQDPALKGYRHVPPIGNTYLKEQTNIFGVMAGVYKDRDPEYAAHMQWMYEQQGKPSLLLIGGDATIDWFVDFTFANIKPVKPDFQSVFYPSFGAVLRHAYATEDETYMAYHHGRFRGHYDADQGSFEMWGKGQPLMLDWGYNGAMPAWQHNTASFSGGGSITNYDSQTWSDLAEAKQEVWSRRILFVKDAKTNGPAYYVIQDVAGDLSKQKKPTALWYWFNTTQTPAKDGQNIRVKGRAGVDLDVWFDQAAADSLPMYTAKEWEKHLAKVKTEADAKATVAAKAKANAKGKAKDTDTDAEVSDAPLEFATADNAVKTKNNTVKAYAGNDGSWKMSSTTQEGLAVPFASDKTITTVLFPRKAGEKPAVITSLEQGKCLRVVTDAGTDYLFFADEPMDVTVDKNIHFKGRVGVIQIRSDATYLTLHDGQSISSGSAKLEQSQGKSRRVAR